MKTNTPREYAFDRFNEAMNDPHATQDERVLRCTNYIEICIRERTRPTNSWLNAARDICHPMVSA